ncbi:TIGR02117 family protein [Sphingomonas sp. Leaf17]|uniref:TIGR02117 family protein n=1 Tax=Sphingomonas sp. Leaf17 TaxID=1735683 RepID=UPI0012E17E71|nr:TIGR02117 family protein [Sphingomonas sp. Leaf17]
MTRETGIAGGRWPARIGGWLARGAGGLVLVVALYVLAGFVGGAIPMNRDWTEAADGIVIFVESNGVHTGIVVPKVAAGVDWRGFARAEDLRDPRYGGHDHLSVGWGEKRFYLETPTWAEVKPATIAAAAFGSTDTLVHVDHVPLPAASADVRRIVLRREEYRRLAAYIRASVADGAAHYPGYGEYDAFYDGRGRYSAVTTCNSWTGAALRFAGVRVGAWTPFPATVLWWF